MTNKDAVCAGEIDEAVYGPMNGPEDPHPVTIRSVCRILGVPLPEDAVCGKQPSKYMPRGILTGEADFIREALGKFMPEMDDEELRKALWLFKRKYKTQNCLTFTRNDLTVYFCDWLLYCRDRGFTHNCYFDYELYNKEPEIRDTFINEGFRTRIYTSCREKVKGKYLLDKGIFNETFKKYVKRDWIDASTCSYEDYLDFYRNHERFFAKPVRGTGGAGARVVVTGEQTAEDFYEICKEEQLILEDIVQQHEALAEFNADSLNTTRVITLVGVDNVPRIIFSVVRFGRSGLCVDNFHGGGVGAIIDPETGKIISNAINRVHDKVTEHPDSHKKFVGFQYPHWDKVKAAVLDAAMIVPEMRSVGWDVAVTKDGDVEFIEGNGKPNFHLPQSPDQTGRRYKYAELLKDIEKMKGIEIEEPGPVEIIEYDAPLREKPKTNPSSGLKNFLRRGKRWLKRKLGK